MIHTCMLYIIPLHTSIYLIPSVFCKVCQPCTLFYGNGQSVVQRQALTKKALIELSITMSLNVWHVFPSCFISMFFLPPCALYNSTYRSGNFLCVI